MDENLIQQLLDEEIPDWEFEEFHCIKQKKISTTNGDNQSVYTDGDEEADSTQMFPLSNHGGVTSSSFNDIISVVSSNGTPMTSPPSQRRLLLSPISSEKDRNLSKRLLLPHKTGRIIKHAILMKIANQISTSKARANTGTATCCARGKFLAIGTSKGVTFLFDLKQILKFYIGLEDDMSKFGAVSSLSFNMGSTRILVGFVKAHINMWDISGTEGKLLRSIDVNQGPGYAVSFVRFLPDPTMAVYSDTNGSVFQLIFKRGIGGRSTDLECFFSGSRGEILCLESLFIPKNMRGTELEEYSLLAMASFTKVIIVSCKPHLKVKYMHPLKGSANTMPHLEWSFNSRLNESDLYASKDVFLTFARDHEVYILKISTANMSSIDVTSETANGDLRFDIVFRMTLDIQILTLKWMNQYFLGIIDFNEKFHAIYVQTKSIIETLEMKSAQIIYNTSLFKSTATGGNVSEAMSVAAERACYHSVIELNGQIKLLGQQEMHIVMLRPWMEAIDVVQKNQGPESTFKICSELYRGNNLTCRQVLMLPSRTEDRHRAVTKVALNLIDMMLITAPRLLDLDSFFNSMLDMCHNIRQIKYYTNSVFNKLGHHSELETAFIRSILPLIRNGTISHLHPELVQRIVEYLQTSGQFSELDICITKLDISCLDLDQIIKLSTKYNLFSSFIHVYNSAFNDFLTPLKFMIEYMSNVAFDSCDRDIQSDTVMKTIIYIQSCFIGKDFFSGNPLTLKNVEEIKSNVFEYLIPYSTTSDLGSLNILLKYNTSAFLNMITLVFEEPFFSSDIGISRKQATIQRLCNCFTSDNLSLAHKETIRFFIFLSRELNQPSNVSVYIEPQILDELIERVCLGINDSALICDPNSQTTVNFLHKQAETAFVNFLKNSSAYRHHWLKNERILTLSRKAQFYRVCEFIYRQKKMLHMVLECFLLDPDYRTQAFELMESAWNDDGVGEDQRIQMAEKCFQLLECLILANPTLSVILLVTVCKKRIEDVIARLESLQTTTHPTNQYKFCFLKSFFIIRNEIEEHDGDIDSHTEVSQEISNAIKSIKVQSSVAELFIDLLCQFEPQVLQSYLQYSVDYRNDNAISIISKYNVPYSLGFLYEKSKKFYLASCLYIKTFDNLWKECVDDLSLKLEHCIISSGTGKSFQKCLDRFVHLIKKCKSASIETNEFWTQMLDSVLVKQSRPNREPCDTMIEVVFTYFVKILSQEVSMATIMVTIFKNPSFKGKSFGKIRELVISMMNSFNYETVFLESCMALVDSDVNNCLVQLNNAMYRGYVVRDTWCSICGKDFNYLCQQHDRTDILAFKCGHRFHGDCFNSTRNVTNQRNTSKAVHCPLCSVNRLLSGSPHLKSPNNLLPDRSTPDRMKGVNQSTGAHTPTNGLMSHRCPTGDPTRMIGRNSDTFHPISSFHKVIDCPLKLNLAPPNYLLNFCTLE